MSEFRTAIYYRYLSTYDALRSSGVKPELIVKCTSESATDEVERSQSPSSKRGTTFTSEGPAAYAGDILDNPDMLWTEDVWDEGREEEARNKLAAQGGAVSDYWKSQYENKAGSFWHKFYKRNADHFYKDRHYLHVVFPELLGGSTSTAEPNSKPFHLLEVGCGVGNAVLPLVELNPNLHVVAVDFAKSAIEILNKHPFTKLCIDELPERSLNTDYFEDSRTLSTSSSTAVSNCDNTNPGPNRRVCTAVRCVVRDPLPVPSGTMDLALCMFVLSAISPQDQLVALRKISDSLKPGGKLLIRDYGRYDEAQLRFKKGSKLAENFYVRQDGTCSYFFALDELQAQCVTVGLQLEEGHYVRRQYANRQQKEARRRVWIHAKFVKAAQSSGSSGSSGSTAL